VIGNGQSVLLGLLIVICVGFSFGSEQFYSFENIIAIVRQSALVLIVASGMTLLLIAAEVDLSVGAALAFVGCVAMDATNQSGSVAIGAAAGILFGGAIGLVNGLVVTKLRVNSLIATIAMLMILQGGVFLYTREAVQNRHQIPSFTQISTGYVGLVPVPVILAVAVFLTAFVALRFTLFGRSIYAVGANATAARLSGMRPERIKLTLFVITGLLTGLAGLILASLMNTGQPTAGRGFELTVVAAVILGGTSLMGGRGTLIGTLLGVLILKVIDNGIIILQLDQNYQMIVPGVVIILATWLDLLRSRSNA
jgi:ribose transport system permease protein